MRNFRFKSIWLLSEREQRARKESFSPQKTLLVGMNHTGKSSLIKSLFIALGAFPTGKLANWSEDAVTVVEISINDFTYYIVQQYNSRSIFDASGKFLSAASNATDWGREFSKLVGLNLILTDKQAQSVPADARAFFLPFYINQDGSWLAEWSTFSNLQQYQKPVQSILDYFSGIKPPEYYHISAEKLGYQKELSKLKDEVKVVNSVKDRFNKAVPLNGPKTNLEIFEKDVNRLTQELTELNAEQEKLRAGLVREKEALESLATQLKLARDALAHYDRDATYLKTKTDDVLVCPTCHAEHDKAFIDLLNYSEDARVLRKLTIKLEEDLKTGKIRYEGSRGRLLELNDKYASIKEILDTRRGDLLLDDVVRAMGAEAALSAFDSELSSLENKIDPLVGAIDKLNDTLAALTSVARSKKILELFRSSYVAALHELNMPPVDTKGLKLTSRPKISGSGGPRSVLAYYSALWNTALGEYGSFSVPVVVDSPQQQGQDAANLPVMIKYIAEKLPHNMQVIVALETPTDIKFDKVIFLDEAYHVLKPEMYNEIAGFVKPLVDEMNKKISSSD